MQNCFCTYHLPNWAVLYVHVYNGMIYFTRCSVFLLFSLAMLRVYKGVYIRIHVLVDVLSYMSRVNQAVSICLIMWNLKRQTVSIAMFDWQMTNSWCCKPRVPATIVKSTFALWPTSPQNSCITTPITNLRNKITTLTK